VVIKHAELNDRTARKLFIVEAVILGAKKSRLATALKISQQAIDNYLEVKEYFGLEGPIKGYSLKDNRDNRKHRKDHAENSDFLPCGVSEQITEINRKKNKRNKIRVSPLALGLTQWRLVQWRLVRCWQFSPLCRGCL
jgi:hypothetical protein